jgi:hypothetical protein
VNLSTRQTDEDGNVIGGRWIELIVEGDSVYIVSLIQSGVI